MGGTPVSLLLKPDGGELFVCNFEADTISAINTAANEVSESFLAGSSPVRGVFSGGQQRALRQQPGSNSVAVFDVATTEAAGQRFGGRASRTQMVLTPDEQLLFVADSGSGDVSVLRLDRRADKKNPAPPQRLFTLIPVGMQPNGIAFKALPASTP